NAADSRTRRLRRKESAHSTAWRAGDAPRHGLGKSGVGDSARRSCRVRGLSVGRRRYLILVGRAGVLAARIGGRKPAGAARYAVSLDRRACLDESGVREVGRLAQRGGLSTLVRGGGKVVRSQAVKLDQDSGGVRPLKSNNVVLYRQLLAQARPYWPNLLGLLLLNLLGSPLSLLMPLPLKIAVDGSLGNLPVPRPLAGLLPANAAHSQTALLAFAAILLVVLALLSQLQGLATSLVGSYTAE